MKPIRAAAVVLAAFLTLAPSAHAQRKARVKRVPQPEELHGSVASVERMYDFAMSHGLPFYRTPENVIDGISQGHLIALTADSTFELKSDVHFSFVTREASLFVHAFAPQYRTACGVPLTVTSAERPVTKQPRNSNPHSVHPTGIAVDFRRPPAGPCLTWMRSALVELERKGLIEATEERHPVHLHVAVLVAPGTPVTLPQLVHSLASHPTAAGTQSADRQ
ncbi:MAG: Peptidase [Gemmatimonadetes bacterium]|nr:Peptidase [Gemmatimonadota bacterium]